MREPSSNGRGNLLFLTPCGCSSSFVPDPCASFLLRFSRAIGGLTGREGGRRRRPLPPQAGRGALAIGSPRSSSSNHRFVSGPRSPLRLRQWTHRFINLRRNAGLLSCGDLGGSPSRGSLLSPGLNFSVSCEEDQAFLT